MRRIAFRLDANPEIGSGHFSRCFTLAKALRSKGAETLFITNGLPEDLAAKLAADEHRHIAISAKTIDLDAAESGAIIRDFRPDWLVVDHYGLDSTWEESLRPNCRGIFVIDDKANRRHSCDILLDQNYCTELQAKYRVLTSPKTRLLLGPRYALLPPTFGNLRPKCQAVSGNIRQVLICFGGSDKANHTSVAVEAIRPFVHLLDRIDVVGGPLNQNNDKLAAQCAGLPKAVFHRSVGNMAELLSSADLAIGAGGIMNWERACLGIPSLVFGIADNQVPILESLNEAGIVCGQPSMPEADREAITKWLSIALSNPAFLRGLSARSMNLVDGLGTERASRYLLATPLKFRPVTLMDSEQLLRWRNTPEIRNVSLNSKEISPSTHREWLINTLSDPRRKLFIAEDEGQAIGVIRFDLSPPQGTISVYRVPNSQPKGMKLVEQATSWFLLQHPEIERVVAEVKSTNLISLSAFRSAGYTDNSTSLVFERRRS